MTLTSYLCEQGFSSLVNIKTNKLIKFERDKVEIKIFKHSITNMLCVKKNLNSVSLILLVIMD